MMKEEPTEASTRYGYGGSNPEISACTGNVHKSVVISRFSTARVKVKIWGRTPQQGAEKKASGAMPTTHIERRLGLRIPNVTIVGDYRIRGLQKPPLMSLRFRNRNFLIIAFLLAMAACHLALWIRLMPQLRNGFQDFTIFYTGAQLLRTGQASHLYDLATQYRMQQSFTNVPIRSGPLPFNHPPFEAFFFLPFTFFRYWQAYCIWTLLNLGMLAWSGRLLVSHFSQFERISPSLAFLSAIAFFPIAIGTIQGQDVILLLLLVVLALVSIDRKREVLGGAILAAGLFRPQLAVPLIVLFAFRRWRILLGVLPVTAVLGGITVAYLGWNGPADYVRFVLHLEGTHARAFGVERVPNFRGLFMDLPGLDPAGPVAHSLIFLSSAIVFLLALSKLRSSRAPVIEFFGLAIVTSILVSFHALVYDLSVIYPIALVLLARLMKGLGRIRASDLLLTLLLFLTPLYVTLLHIVDCFFWFSLVVLWLYIELLPGRLAPQVPVPA